MSLLGKILALLNLFGAVGLVYVGTLDYAARQKWAYHYFLHELALDGLPLDENQRDAENRPVVERLAGDLPGALFNSVGGNPVATQTQEVQRLQALLDGKLQSAQNAASASHLLARILLPLADSPLERDELLACRAHLATDATVAALRKRCEEGFREALRPVPAEDLQPRSLHEAFRLAFRAQGGPPADYFVSLLLARIPDDRAKAAGVKINAEFDAALQAQLAGLQGRYAGAFADARGDKARPGAAGVALQKGAIARLLLGLSLFLAEDELLSGGKGLAGSPDQPDYQRAVVGSEPYHRNLRRTYIVCGLRSGLEAVSERAGALRRLGDYVRRSVGAERHQFLLDHATLVEQLREHATVAREEQLRIGENEKRLEEYNGLIRLRTKEIADLEAELAKSRAQTKEEMQHLRQKSERVLELRVRLRDAIRDNERGEGRIRELEKRIRELEK